MDIMGKALSPEAPLYWFSILSQIPRGSGNERAVSDFLLRFAAERGLTARRDDALNVVIEKPASAGRETAAPLVLQGHTDMVCEKLPGSRHDFTRDPVRLLVDGDRLHADKTTLGADDGAGVALMLSVLDDKTLSHPPLECLFTTGEEIGLLGARALTRDFLRGRRLINMDMNVEGVFIRSCAGSETYDIALPVKTEPAGAQTAELAAVRLSLGGLSGGHSGLRIGDGLQNALSLTAALLGRLRAAFPLRLAALDGGDKLNAIPRDCACTVVMEKENIGKAIALTEAFRGAVAARLVPEDAGFTVKADPLPLPELCLTADSTAALCELMLLMPHGPVLRDMAADGFVLSSQNFAFAHLRAGEARLCLSARSADDDVLGEMGLRLRTLLARFGAAWSIHGVYPSWPRDPDSALRSLCMRIYEEQTGKPASLADTHGGVEGAFFRRTWPDMDIVVCGPNFYNCHTPDEWLSLSSFVRFYDWLRRVLAAA